MIWARAKTAAKNLGDQAWAFRAGFWEADATIKMGQLQAARDLLFSLYCQPPPDAPDYELWLTAQQLVITQILVRPEKQFLERRVAELETLSQQVTVPAADLLWVKAVFAFHSGLLENALGFFVEGWQGHDGTGGLRSGFASNAAATCLDLQRRDEAESWVQRGRPEADCHQSERIGFQARLCQLALFDRNIEVLSDYFEIGEGNQPLEMRAILLHRDDAFDSIHDPDDSSHPARKLSRTTRTEDVHERFGSLLDQVDYRLACLRFTAGLPACDDLYYQHPDELPAFLHLSDPAKFQRQLLGFRRSWRRLRRHAEYVDGLLECQWRMHECEARWMRAQRIAKACGVEFPLPPVEPERKPSI
jgi:hypothetical protein